jgi:flavin reductase (DIM6/NTAB) family NADH-FMN oxidoreductase RutF
MIGRVVSGDELRAAMRRLPAPICVVTVDFEGDRIGLTVGSLVSLSLEPPLVGIAIGNQQAAHALIRGAGTFEASLLSGEQEAVARHFAHGVPPLAMWHGVELVPGGVAPRLYGALAWLDCRVWAEYDAGDHTLFVGEVTATELGEPGFALAYRGSTYHPVP